MSCFKIMLMVLMKTIQGSFALIVNIFCRAIDIRLVDYKLLFCSMHSYRYILCDCERNGENFNLFEQIIVTMIGKLTLWDALATHLDTPASGSEIETPLAALGAPNVWHLGWNSQN